MAAPAHGDTPVDALRRVLVGKSGRMRRKLQRRFGERAARPRPVPMAIVLGRDFAGYWRAHRAGRQGPRWARTPYRQ